MAYDDDTKVFDVSKPHKVAPSATSRPIIVGHHPQTIDPMMREEEHSELMEHANDDTLPKSTSIPVSIDEEDKADEIEISPLGKIDASDEDEIDFGSFSVDKDKNEHLDRSEDTKKEELPTERPLEEETKELDKPSKDASSGVGSSGLNSMFHPEDKPKDEKISSGGSKPPDVPIATEVTPPLHIPSGAGPRRRIPKLLIWLGLGSLALLIGAFLAIDLGLVKSDIKLPFHIFNKQKTSESESAPPPPVATPPSRPSNEPAAPNGFTQYKLPDTAISFAYPTTWGTPSITKVEGFSKRGGTNRSDGTFAHLVKFSASNVEIAATSSKYLQASTASENYYSFLKWCIGTSDTKTYREVLKSVKENNIDVPTTVTCDNGPLASAIKLDETTILQPKHKESTNDIRGDLYTKNLTSSEWPVLRVMDITSDKSDQVKRLLGTVKVTAHTTP